MFFSFIYIVLALLGISFLIFIHELGHYFMAKKVGIRVEAFAIGFGKPILKWMRDGVEWRIGWLPFGGYVKMAGMERQGSIEPSEIKDGFFGSKPLDRIKVAFCGPFINILFAFLAFSFLWVIGGRDKSFSEFTHYVGWVQKDSALYNADLRPGDTILKINQKPFVNFEGLLYAAVLDKPPLTISGHLINYYTGKTTPFSHTFSLDKKQDEMARATVAFKSIQPAQFLIYDKMPTGKENPLVPKSSAANSGISYGDRLLWVDGELIFSQLQLMQVVNSQKVLLTVERNGKTFLTRVPRIQVRNLRLTKAEKEELDDWRTEAKLTQKIDELNFIPYNISAEAVIENPVGYIGSKAESKNYFDPPPRSYSEKALEIGDRIIAIQGEKVSSAYDFFRALQTKKSLVVVGKTLPSKPLSWKEADQDFATSFNMSELKQITESIGTDKPVSKVGSLTLLNPITPAPMEIFPLDPLSHKKRAEKLKKHEKKIEEIEDVKQKEQAQEQFKNYKERLVLGFNLQDKLVAYNPSPFVLFGNVFRDTYRTLFALVTGYLSPKHIAGPVGIVQVIQKGWSVGAQEALFWLGMISLNLGLLNLLPIPVLDGGYIVLALVECVTKKPLKAKTMERLIFPFILLVVAFFIYLTYHDLARIITQFFK